jgi:mRNA-degrading endonuclease toxin of MazEF toxin-antitoxin module
MGSVQVERGDFFTLNLKLDPSIDTMRRVGHEIHGDRFAIVVQCDEQNRLRPKGIFLVVPTTGELRYRSLPDSVFVSAVTEEVNDCVAQVRQMFGADRKRLEKFIGKVSPNVMAKIDEKLRYVLAL